MAGFVCDICGGQIKMQANKTGVCQNCGMEYDIEAIRAMAGSNISNESTQLVMADKSNAITEQHRKNNDIDREALTIYLGDLRIMESVINKSRERVSELENKKQELKNEYENVKKNSENKKKDKPERKKPNIDKPNSRTEVCICILGIVFFLIAVFFAQVSDEGYNALSAFLFILSLGIFLSIYTSHKKYKNALNKVQFEYDIACDKWSKEVNEYKEKAVKTHKKYMNGTEEIDKNIGDINEDITEMTDDLEKAYSLNIIPKQFRNIEGIFYLYDYIATSDQSLSESLMQANLDAIKNSLATIMKQQAEQVIIQAQQAQDLMAINTKTTYIMQSAMNTASNSAMAAKYSEMIAIDVELMKNMQHKQLNYQRADFWLK